ncbi:unnamed protein product, partial [Discosporangium mesarthrocarpum]
GLTARSVSGSSRMLWRQCAAVRTVRRGTKMLKPATVNAERYNELMFDKVIPAIKARMPRPPGHTIFVQQDGAKPHTGGGAMEAIQARAWDIIILETQPANSPDLNVNVNDLGFFHYIQQLKEDVGVSSPEDLGEVTL